MSYEESNKLEAVLRNQLECRSRSFWLLSTLIHTINANGFVPQEPNLFQELISSLTFSLVTSTRLSSSSINFMQSKRRESILSHFPSHVADCHKTDLLASPMSKKSLFGSKDLGRIIGEVKEDSSTKPSSLWLPLFLFLPSLGQLLEVRPHLQGLLREGGRVDFRGRGRDFSGLGRGQKRKTPQEGGPPPKSPRRQNPAPRGRGFPK